MVEDALQAVLEILLVGRRDAVTLLGHSCEQRRGFGIDEHAFFEVARPVVGSRPVLLVQPLQHH